MVVFTCQCCGESVKKTTVHKHYATKCRFKNPQLTCVDCLKDFSYDNFDRHNDCMTELQRYSAEGTVFKEQKGKKKQEKYIEMIQQVLNSQDLSSDHRKLLEVCSNYTNVPRKLDRFKNFMKNVTRNISYKPGDIDVVFNLIENGWKKHQQGNTVGQVKKSQERVLHEETNISVVNGKTGDEGNEEMNDKNNTCINKTKKKRHSDKALSSDGVENDMAVNGRKQKDINVDSSNKETSKSKKKKLKPESFSLDYDETNLKDSDKCSSNEQSTNVKEEDTIDTKENINNFSKKQLRKQKKYEKYLAELDNEAKSEFCESMHSAEVTADTEITKKKKKKLKSENHKLESESSTLSEGNLNTDDSIKKGNSKKNNKRKLEESNCETPEKKIKEHPDEGDEQPAVFSWGDIIVRVLQSRHDNELSLKKLGKKVVNEYQAIKQDHRTYEELLAKFNKKVHKTKGVKVLRDKAKLVE